MASATNWLSFSLSPIEMLRSSQPQMLPVTSASHQHYFVESFYGNEWAGPKAEAALYAGTDNHDEVKDMAVADSCVLSGYINSETHHSSPVIPKLEDFLGGDPSIVQYSDSQTETQDSSLTHIYDQGSAYFADQHDLKAMGPPALAFQAFPANSGSEVDDSMSISRAQAQVAGGEFGSQSIESSGNELAVSHCPTEGLSLGVHKSSDQKSLVAVDMESTKRIADTFGQRTSIYRGVTRHRWTGRYEAHLWDNSCRREGQARKGRQGGYDKEEKAARAYDLAALKYWGPSATTNFPISNYSKELEEMKHVTKQEFIASLRRKSSGFSRGASIYRGVTRHHQQGRWQARIGRVAGNKDLYLGTFATEEEAAEAYDIAAIKFRGVNAVTNFEMNRYDVEAIANSNLPIGGAAKRLKLSLDSEQKPSLTNELQPQCSSSSSSINFGPVQPVPTISCGVPFDPPTALYHHNLFHHLQSNSDSPGTTSSVGTSMTLVPAPAEFFLWPHQSY
ncbi:AP2-like ethylene-responsive transcription factor AIL6 isoform X2 [Malania oleifera]|uniref:AP2-like ethylene-responsive transcription factor AIL6 isoform X2 n=1 Tax=Malania oleifera TaxID=397392 RepID=UPI0025ADA861|nr:AP2-like ethylene-responsive transcription factor AIL6 isoform X2 [Malania oleifera]